jgi:hypothetical protein
MQRAAIWNDNRTPIEATRSALSDQSTGEVRSSAEIMPKRWAASMRFGTRGSDPRRHRASNASADAVPPGKQPPRHSDPFR